MEKDSAYEKMKALRSDTVFPASGISFKKTLFGGYQPDEVEDYIQSLKNNMQLSEKVFNEKIEEYASASNLFSQERDSLNQKIRDCERELQVLRAANQESAQREEAAALRGQQELQEALALVETLREQISSSEQSAEAIREIEELQGKNKSLTAELFRQTEANQKLELKNVALLGELDRLAKYNDRLLAELDAFKKEVGELKISKRNHIMKTNMQIYEYRQGQESGLDSISSNMGEIHAIVETMRRNLSDLFNKTRTYLNEEDLDND